MDKHIIAIESDEFIGSAAEFVLSYNIPLDWDVYGSEDGKFVAVTSRHSQKYDDLEGWEHIGLAYQFDTSPGDLSVDERLIIRIPDDQWEMWDEGDCGTDARVWGVFNGNPYVFKPEDLFNRHLFEPLWVGQLELAWESLFPMLTKLLEENGFFLEHRNVLTKYYKVLGGVAEVSLILNNKGLIYFLQNNEEIVQGFSEDDKTSLVSALNPRNDSVENSEKLIRFVVSVSEKIIEWVDELSEEWIDELSE